MKLERRGFLRGAAWSGAAALAAGCRGMAGMCPGGSMAGFRCAPMKTIRISGTRGIFKGCYFAGDDSETAFAQGCGCRFGWTVEAGGQVHNFFDSRRTEEMRKKRMHPYWRAAGEMAKKIGGHGGMDFLMDLRWICCLQNGLPLDPAKMGIGA